MRESECVYGRCGVCVCECVGWGICVCMRVSVCGVGCMYVWGGVCVCM